MSIKLFIDKLVDKGICDRVKLLKILSEVKKERSITVQFPLEKNYVVYLSFVRNFLCLINAHVIL